jgi:hypothetical protein
MRLFQKAKRLGTWDPQAIDFSAYAPVWASFDATELISSSPACSSTNG